MIKFITILNEISSEVYSDSPNTWTHVTNRPETIEAIKKAKMFWGINEEASEFNYEINKGLSANKQNPNSPNFYRGKLYPGTKGTYLITFKATKSFPVDDFESNDWKTVDYPLIPNGNRGNRISFQKSYNIGVLKPEFRDAKNFKFYQYDPSTKKYLLIKDILKESTNPNIYLIYCRIVVNADARPMGDILSDVRAIPGVTIVDIVDADSKTHGIRHVADISLKIDPNPFEPFDGKSYGTILNAIKKIPSVYTAKFTSTPVVV